MDIGDSIGYVLPYFAIITVIVLCITALVSGLSTRTTRASLLGMFTGMVLAMMLILSIM